MSIFSPNTEEECIEVTTKDGKRVKVCVVKKEDKPDQLCFELPTKDNKNMSFCVNMEQGMKLIQSLPEEEQRKVMKLLG